MSAPSDAVAPPPIPKNVRNLVLWAQDTVQRYSSTGQVTTLEDAFNALLGAVSALLNTTDAGAMRKPTKGSTELLEFLIAYGADENAGYTRDELVAAFLVAATEGALRRVREESGAPPVVPVPVRTALVPPPPAPPVPAPPNL